MIVKDNNKFIVFDKVNAVEVVQTADGKYTLAFYLEGGIICTGEYSTVQKANEVLEEILKEGKGINWIYDVPVEQKTKEEIWKETVSERGE